jgi:hypothetical protein
MDDDGVGGWPLWVREANGWCWCRGLAFEYVLKLSGQLKNHKRQVPGEPLLTHQLTNRVISTASLDIGICALEGSNADEKRSLPKNCTSPSVVTSSARPHSSLALLNAISTAPKSSHLSHALVASVFRPN